MQSVAGFTLEVAAPHTVVGLDEAEDRHGGLAPLELLELLSALLGDPLGLVPVECRWRGDYRHIRRLAHLGVGVLSGGGVGGGTLFLEWITLQGAHRRKRAGLVRPARCGRCAFRTGQQRQTGTGN